MLPPARRGASPLCQSCQAFSMSDQGAMRMGGWGGWVGEHRTVSDGMGTAWMPAHAVARRYRWSGPGTPTTQAGTHTQTHSHSHTHTPHPPHTDHTQQTVRPEHTADPDQTQTPDLVTPWRTNRAITPTDIIHQSPPAPPSNLRRQPAAAPATRYLCHEMALT